MAIPAYLSMYFILYVDAVYEYMVIVDPQVFIHEFYSLFYRTTHICDDRQFPGVNHHILFFISLRHTSTWAVLIFTYLSMHFILYFAAVNGYGYVGINKRDIFINEFYSLMFRNT